MLSTQVHLPWKQKQIDVPFMHRICLNIHHRLCIHTVCMKGNHPPPSLFSFPHPNSAQMSRPGCAPTSTKKSSQNTQSSPGISHSESLNFECLPIHWYLSKLSWIDVVKAIIYLFEYTKGSPTYPVNTWRTIPVVYPTLYFLQAKQNAWHTLSGRQENISKRVSEWHGWMGWGQVQ